MRYRIFTEWHCNEPGATYRDDTGLVVDANNVEEALGVAARMGVASGLGFNPRYVGLVAEKE